VADRHADLRVVAGCAVIAAAIVLLDFSPEPLQILAGVPLALLLPGYALTRAMFRDLRAGVAELTVLSLALSVSIAIAIGLVVTISPWSLTADSWTLLLLGVTLLACAVAWRRDSERRLEAGGLGPPRPRDVALLAAAAVLAVGAVALARTPLPPPDEVRGYTELSQVRKGDAIELKVAANELRAVRYRVEVRADGRLVRRWRIGTLMPGERWRATLPVSAARRARTLETRLYRSSSKRSYRRVRVDL
jgi:uncharacterized membrane protein